MLEDLTNLLPELLLAGAAVLGLLLGSYLPRRKQWMVRLLVALTCAAGLAATVARWTQQATTTFENAYAIDVATNTVRTVVLLSVLLVLGLATSETRDQPRETEFVVLLSLGALGAVLLAGANDLLLLAAAYLLASVPLYALTAFAKDSPGTEAALKYYLMGALLGVLMLFGLTTLFGVAHATIYPRLATTLPSAPPAAVAFGAALLLAGPLFKAGGVPVHFWVPDAAQGARPAVAAVITTIPKIGAVVAVYRFATTGLAPTTLDWRLLVAILAALTMTLGNLAAFFQDNVRRLLAYSTISQVGYLLMAVAAAGLSALALPSLLLYLTAYAVTNLGAFAVTAAFPGTDTLAGYRGLLHRNRGAALSLVVCLLGLVGTPPTGVFTGKLTVFTAALDAGLTWLVVIAVLNTVASLFYYLRWITPAVSTEPGIGEPVSRWPLFTAAVAAALAVGIGPLAGILVTVFEGDLAAR
ncbi:NADH-quinone oxidoreductase subunit N [Saccharomonospora xinjiangensis]|uniref:NADH-quinone oxidoreductase subunit N n=1 Tax=Saccharomonospora xinjiangensis XJ-54 TaxID=882086 RepID=I0V8Q4_9PSEU|nr:NADH-quinone oxidoreductase subunit N [Saccharomonospora xinjiangensis]EID56507.1 NADH:ubiquinone oxidoreductase subunit 2 (chain N) [Saccharomonospora xinjiangensis XJ-54]